MDATDTTKLDQTPARTSRRSGRTPSVLYIADLNELLPRDAQRVDRGSSPLKWCMFRGRADITTAGIKYNLRRESVRTRADGLALLGVYDEILAVYCCNRVAGLRGWLVGHDLRAASAAQVAVAIGTPQVRLVARALKVLEDVGLLLRCELPDLADALAHDKTVAPHGYELNPPTRYDNYRPTQPPPGRPDRPTGPTTRPEGAAPPTTAGQGAEGAAAGSPSDDTAGAGARPGDDRGQDRLAGVAPDAPMPRAGAPPAAGAPAAGSWGSDNRHRDVQTPDGQTSDGSRPAASALTPDLLTAPATACRADAGRPARPPDKTPARPTPIEPTDADPAAGGPGKASLGNPAMARDAAVKLARLAEAAQLERLVPGAGSLVRDTLAALYPDEAAWRGALIGGGYGSMAECRAREEGSVAATWTAVLLAGLTAGQLGGLVEWSGKQVRLLCRRRPRKTRATLWNYEVNQKLRKLVGSANWEQARRLAAGRSA